MKGYPFAGEPLSEILSNLIEHGMEDRSLLRDYALEMARRLRALDEFLNDPQFRWGISGTHLVSVERVRRILDGEVDK